MIGVVELPVQSDDDFKSLQAQVANVDWLCLSLGIIESIFFQLIFKLILNSFDLSHHPFLSLHQVILILLDNTVCFLDDRLKIEVLILNESGQASVDFFQLDVNVSLFFDLVRHWFDHYDVFLALIDLIEVDEPNEVIDKAHSLEKTVLLSALLDLCECLSHDGDQHVHENDRDDESGQEKHWDGE